MTNVIGCYRMRGLGRGQTLHLFIVDEVYELIGRVSKSDSLLNDVIAWLIVNSMRSEKLQHLALCQQQLHNVWRKKAFTELLTSRAPQQDQSRAILISRFMRPARSTQYDKILSDHSILSKKDKAAIQLVKDRDLAKRRLEQILKAMQDQKLKFPMPFQEIIAQSGTFEKVTLGPKHLASFLV
jgi:hypothetical protein